jgi:hypothetical protein
LLRLELVTGKLEVIVSPAGTEFYSFAISPDGSIISVIDQFRSPLRLTLLDAFGGGERHVTLPSDFTIAGSQAWSPTSDSIILAAARTGAEWNPPISILYVDTTVGYTQTLVRDHESLLVPVEWLGPDRVLLTDRRASGATKYVMTISTGELTAYD